MKSQIIAFITAGALATTSLAAPVKADPADDLLRLAIGVAVVGAIVNSANQNDNKVVVTHGNQGQKHKVKKHKNKKVQRSAKKPRQCLVRKWKNGGWKKRYDKNCMAHYGWQRHSGQGWHKHRRQARW